MRHKTDSPRGALQSLEAYGEGFRALINSRVWQAKESPEKVLRLNARSDWEFVCVAMDVIGDASAALDNFLQFSLDGPTKYQDTGERYLRLYGALSAAYLQQESVRKLYALMNCPSPKKIDARFASLEIRTLRHQVASHSVDYREFGSQQVNAYVPIRLDLRGFTCSVSEGRGNSSRTVKLDDALVAHFQAIIETLDAIYEKSIRTFYRGQRTRIAEFNDTLADLREQRTGSVVVIKTGGTNTIRVKLVPSGPVQPTSKSTLKANGVDQ
jgi:hypothetical protein